jgi:subtilisin family serine protease
VKKIIGFLLLVGLAAGCQNASRETINPAAKANISRHPAALPASQGALTALPRFDESNSDPFQIDLSGRDLSGLDLRGAQTELDKAVFDTATIWPAKDKLPADFNPQQILELGKVPGPGLSALHAQGITGKDISIGIVDSTLLVDHQEYADRLMWYEELNTGPDDPAFMHGPGTASIAVGKTVGVAPEANLYFIGQDVTEDVAGGQETVIRGMARGIQRLLEINAGLPKEHKIRVISISLGMGPNSPGWDEFSAALQAADEQGVFVVYIEMNMSDRGPVYIGLGREALADPQDFASYQAGAFWAGYSELKPKSGWIFMPMDSRTLAAPTGSDQYAFYRFGGMSWGPPFLAGMYALAAQVDPAITPQRFWDLAQRTGKPVVLSNGEGVILDPVAFIQALRDPDSIPTVTAASGSTVDPSAIVFPKIDRYPESPPWPDRQTPVSEPVYDPASMDYLSLDLLNNDLSGLDLSNSLENLLMATFDTRTTWPAPEKLPSGFDPQRIMDWGKIPGPGLHSLHDRGITGEGVGIAFIGGPILVNHQEFADRLRLYEESPDAQSASADLFSMLPVSTAAGKTTGVAPGADLYYLATKWGGSDASGAFINDLTYTANAIRRLLAINEHLPQNRKIRVIVIMNNVDVARTGKEECKTAVRDARTAGMLVIGLTGGDGRPQLGTSEGLVFEGLGRTPLADPEIFESYSYWGDLNRWQYDPKKYFGENQIFFPMDSRTLANASSVDGYTFYRQSTSWQTGTGGYIAGAYALAAQVDPGITPARFFELARQTGRTWQVEYKGKPYTLGPVLDLPALIAVLRNP